MKEVIEKCNKVRIVKSDGKNSSGSVLELLELAFAYNEIFSSAHSLSK